MKQCLFISRSIKKLFKVIHRMKKWNFSKAFKNYSIFVSAHYKRTCSIRKKAIHCINGKLNNKWYSRTCCYIACPLYGVKISNLVYRIYKFLVFLWNIYIYWPSNLLQLFLLYKTISCVTFMYGFVFFLKLMFQSQFIMFCD